MCVIATFSITSYYEHASNVLHQLLKDLQNMQNKEIKGGEPSYNIGSLNMYISSSSSYPIDIVNVRAPSPIHTKVIQIPFGIKQSKVHRICTTCRKRRHESRTCN